MKVKLFSHQSDPDGLGCVVLASLVYSDFDFTLCKNNKELNLVLQEFIESEGYRSFDKIFVTDLCPSDDILLEMEAKFPDKILVFDHHITALNSLTKEYSFVTLKEEEQGHFCCGTSLFYEYLKNESDILETPYIKTFIEYTRLHDTWEWKATNHLDSYHLQTLFSHLEAFGYFYHFREKCLSSKASFSYDKQEVAWILKQERIEAEALKTLLEHLVIKKEGNTTYGTVIGKYDYRNVLAEELKKVKQNLDILILLAYDNGTVSFRSLKEIPVEPLAREYGGGGHPETAACLLTKEAELKLIKRFLV